MSKAIKCDVCGELYKIIKEPFVAEIGLNGSVRFLNNSYDELEFQVCINGRTLKCCPKCIEAVRNTLVSRRCKLK